MGRARRPTAELIADSIIDDVRSGRLRPGDRIREQEIAARFSISRGPVREALRSLTSQHWVEHEPGKGVRVIDADRSADPDAAVIGTALSRVLARFATTRSSEAELDELDQRVRNLCTAAKAGTDPSAFSEMSWDLGRFMLRIGRSPLLTQLMETFQRGALPHISVPGVGTQWQQIEAARIYVDLAIALRRRDVAEAEMVMVRSIDRSRLARHRAALDPDLFEPRWSAPMERPSDKE